MCVIALITVHARTMTVPLTWEDTAPLRDRLEATGVTSEGFAARLKEIRESNAGRVREGDLDHLVFYLLQSTRFTAQSPIEPALSAKALVDELDPPEKQAFLRNPGAATSHVPAAVRSRAAAMLRALDFSDRDARLAYFRSLVKTAFPERAGREAAIVREYLRVMKFVYEKEFVAQRSARGPDAVADLYRTRGLSTDTSVEAGFLVHQGLAVLRALEPKRVIRRVLIVGPGLDLAPRTAFLETGPPESYQPWSVIDALLGLGLSSVSALQVVAGDVNPRVVEHLRRAQNHPPSLTLLSEIRDSDTVTLTQEYRDYFAQLGRAIGMPGAGAPDALKAGHLTKTVRVRGDIARMLRAETLDIVTERLDGPAFDLIVATNILPYFDDVQFMFAMANIARMLAEDGIFLHNEARPLMHDVTTALRLPVEQSRHAIIASVRGPSPPLVDSVWLHRKGKSTMH